MLKDVESSAAALYDGGWRSDDREDLISEYELTEDEADALCEELKRLEDSAMKHYEVDYIDPETGATSPIDNVEAKAGYTAEDYVRDCEENADEEWVDMLHRGTVKLIEVDD